MVFFAARNIAFFGETRALQELERSLERGFVLYRVLLRDDPWLDPLRATSKFQFLFERSREAYRQCRQAYLDAGGERLLGPVPSPEELEKALHHGHAAEEQTGGRQTNAPAGEPTRLQGDRAALRRTSRSTSAGAHDTRAIARTDYAVAAGVTFWFIRNTLSGSDFAFSVANRWSFAAPYAACRPSGPSSPE